MGLNARLRGFSRSALVRAQEISFCAAFLVIFSASALAAPFEILYGLKPVPPLGATRAVTRITITVSHLEGEQSIRFQMPVWSPGDYHRQDFAQYVTAV